MLAKGWGKIYIQPLFDATLASVFARLGYDGTGSWSGSIQHEVSRRGRAYEGIGGRPLGRFDN